VEVQADVKGALRNRSWIGWLAILVGAVLTATSQGMAWEGDWTVVTFARNGSWGVANDQLQGQAIAAAIRDCKAMSVSPSDCGAQFTTTRAGWTIANLCGDYAIIVTGNSRVEAEKAALAREFT
jgi:hypothetical protein